jgi:hypothetical protein
MVQERSKDAQHFKNLNNFESHRSLKSLDRKNLRYSSKQSDRKVGVGHHKRNSTHQGHEEIIVQRQLHIVDEQ